MRAFELVWVVGKSLLISPQYLLVAAIAVQTCWASTLQVVGLRILEAYDERRGPSRQQGHQQGRGDPFLAENLVQNDRSSPP